MNRLQIQRQLTELYALYNESDVELAAEIVPVLQDTLQKIVDRKHCSKQEARSYLGLYVSEAQARFSMRKKPAKTKAPLANSQPTTHQPLTQ